MGIREKSLSYSLPQASGYLCSTPVQNFSLKIFSHELVPGICCQRELAFGFSVTFSAAWIAELIYTYGEHLIVCGIVAEDMTSLCDRIPFSKPFGPPTLYQEWNLLVPQHIHSAISNIGATEWYQYGFAAKVSQLMFPLYVPFEDHRLLPVHRTLALKLTHQKRKCLCKRSNFSKSWFCFPKYPAWAMYWILFFLLWFREVNSVALCRCLFQT